MSCLRVRRRFLAFLVAAGCLVMAGPPTGDATRSDRINGAGRVTAPAERLTPVVRQLSISGTGDILPHSPLWSQAASNAGGVGFDFAPMFADIAPVIGLADLSICHLETPIVPVGQAPSTYPQYGVPVEVTNAIASAGYDRCSTASNHTFDRGVAGIGRTVSSLESVGVQQSGMARTPAEATPQVVSVNGAAVAHLSYTYGFNGAYVPSGQQWRSPLINAGRIIADSRAARQRGAELVVLSLHWGVEYDRQPSAEQRRVAEAVTASGAVDLVLGHHAHVLQPIERINGVWVAFGLGNFLSNMRESAWFPASSQDGAIVDFNVTFVVNAEKSTGFEAVVDRPRVTPTWVDRDNGWVIRDVHAQLADPTIPGGRRAALLRSLARTTAVVGEFVQR